MPTWESAQRLLDHAAVAAGDARVARGLAFIGGHLDRPIYLDDVAAEAGVEPQYFSRLFQRKTGWRLGALIEHLRVTRACELLATTATVACIAARVGYCEIGTFERAFRRQTGQSPRSYRRLKGAFFYRISARFEGASKCRLVKTDGASGSGR